MTKRNYPEEKFQLQAEDQLRRRGWFVVKSYMNTMIAVPTGPDTFTGIPHPNKGYPDTMFLKNGNIFFAEFKAPGHRLPWQTLDTEKQVLNKHGLQMKWQRAIREAGFVCEFVNDMQYLLALANAVELGLQLPLNPIIQSKARAKLEAVNEDGDGTQFKPFIVKCKVRTG